MSSFSFCFILTFVDDELNNPDTSASDPVDPEDLVESLGKDTEEIKTEL
jgi:hypothetical protein